MAPQGGGYRENGGSLGPCSLLTWPAPPQPPPPPPPPRPHAQRPGAPPGEEDLPQPVPWPGPALSLPSRTPGPPLVESALQSPEFPPEGETVLPPPPSPSRPRVNFRRQGRLPPAHPTPGIIGLRAHLVDPSGCCHVSLEEGESSEKRQESACVLQGQPRGRGSGAVTRLWGRGRGTSADPQRRGSGEGRGGHGRCSVN